MEKSARRRARGIPALAVLPLLSLTACNPGSLLGIGGDGGAGSFSPDYSMAPPAHRSDLPCGDSDPGHLCVALKYAVFQDPSGAPILAEDQAVENVLSVNSVWSQCHVQFLLEQYQAIDPATVGLSFQAASQDDLNSVRERLSTGATILVATTGQWVGGLGAQTANAWTNMPPDGPFGSVLEQSVATYPNLISHELGHSLNLQHVADNYDVMNPTVYSNSINLTDSQCAEARATAISFWGAALR